MIIKKLIKMKTALKFSAMKKLQAFSLVVLIMTWLTACDKRDVLDGPSRTFMVRIENVSVPNTLPTDRANGTVPLSHGVFAVYKTGNLFTFGQPADVGTERIAEDGFTTEKTNMLNNTPGITFLGEFVAPGGPDNGAALFAGEVSNFMVIAKPGDKLQIETMFVQSNDWFYSFGGGGLDLFDGKTPISGNVTSKLVLYDAGTEADTAPGTGPNQKPVQPPLAMNVGPSDAVNIITVAPQRHPGFNIPPTASIIKITITPQ